jgi:hypothetical protein
MPVTYIPPDDHLVRYVPWAKLRKDPEDEERVIGVLHTAFRLRDEEKNLSATWLEFFEGDRSQRVVAAVKAIRSSKVDVRPKSGFAIGQVEAIDKTCQLYRKKVRFIHEKQDDNEAHVSIHTWPRDADELFEDLATDAWRETVLNKDVSD